MTLEIMCSLLVAISLLTNVCTEAVKLWNLNIKYYNLIAAIFSLINTILVSYGYFIYSGMTFEFKLIHYVIVLAYLSFLASTVGYDKIIQLLRQLGKGE